MIAFSGKQAKISCAVCALVIGGSLVFSGFAASEPDHHRDEGMTLLGTVLKRFFTIRLVTVGLYIAKEYSAEDIFKDIPKRLDVEYHVHIAKASLDKATINGIEKNVSDEEFRRLSPRINQINSYYRDVYPGDKIKVIYKPGTGTEVIINQDVLGIVPGEDFSRAFFSIWVGKNPVDERAKRQLLGKGNKSS